MLYLRWRKDVIIQIQKRITPGAETYTLNMTHSRNGVDELPILGEDGRKLSRAMVAGTMAHSRRMEENDHPVPRWQGD